MAESPGAYSIVVGSFDGFNTRNAWHWMAHLEQMASARGWAVEHDLPVPHEDGLAVPEGHVVCDGPYRVIRTTKKDIDDVQRRRDAHGR